MRLSTRPPTPLRNALYHNNRDGTFTDVTEKAGVAGGGYGMGVAVGDYDGDGFPDIYVTQYGRSILYHNNGDGTFTDVTDKAGVAATGMGFERRLVRLRQRRTARPVRLPLRRVGPVADAAASRPTARITIASRASSSRRSSWLFHNNGDGTFTDVSKEAGIAEHLGKAWGVVATDINNDGLMDLFVSNDTVANFLLREPGNGRFEEIGLAADVAYSAEGKARSGMGVDSADFNQDGWMDIFVANIDEEIFCALPKQ